MDCYEIRYRHSCPSQDELWWSLNFPPNTIIRLQLSFPVKIAAKLTRFLFSFFFFSMLTCSTKIIPAKASFISLQQLGSYPVGYTSADLNQMELRQFRKNVGTERTVTDQHGRGKKKAQKHI